MAFREAKKRGQCSPPTSKNQRGHWFVVHGRLEDCGVPGGEIASLIALGDAANCRASSHQRVLFAASFGSRVPVRQIVPSEWKKRFRAFPAGPRRAHRFDVVLVGCRPARNCSSAIRPSWIVLYVGRWKRWVFIEPLSEAATIGLAGMVLMLALAVPAFRETSDDDWLKKSDLAVSFLDRYGNPIGNRGIKHNDSIPLEEFPDHLDQGDSSPPKTAASTTTSASTLPVPARALMTNAQAGGVRTGRFVDHPAARQEPVPQQRAHHRAQGEGSVPRDLARNTADQETKSSSSTSTAPIWAAAHSASTARRISISTSPPAT